MNNLKFVRITVDTIEDCIKARIASFPRGRKHNEMLKYTSEQVQRDDMCVFAAYEGDCYKGLIIGADSRFCYRGEIIPCIEVDHMHVDPLARKQGVSRFLIQEFEHFAVDMGYTMIYIGPFSTEFYRQMGYGFGAKHMSFMAKPEHFMFHHEAADTLMYYDEKLHKQDLMDFIRCQRVSYHGSFSYKLETFESELKKFVDGYYMAVLSIKDGNIQGFLSYEPDKNITTGQFLFKSPIGLQALSSYLHMQKGHLDSVKIQYAQPAILAACTKPYDIKLAEMCMIKAVDTSGFIEKLKDIRFDGADFSAAFALHDPLTDTERNISLMLKDGHLSSCKDECDIQIKMAMSDFTTMVYGQVSLKNLWLAGLVQVSETSMIENISKVFVYQDAPYYI